MALPECCGPSSRTGWLIDAAAGGVGYCAWKQRWSSPRGMSLLGCEAFSKVLVQMNKGAIR